MRRGRGTGQIWKGTTRRLGVWGTMDDRSSPLPGFMPDLFMDSDTLALVLLYLYAVSLQNLDKEMFHMRLPCGWKSLIKELFWIWVIIHVIYNLNKFPKIPKQTQKISIPNKKNSKPKVLKFSGCHTEPILNHSVQDLVLPI